MTNLYSPLLPSGLYHVLNHANGAENIFRNDGNYRYFLQQYAKYIYPIAATYAYCLLPNHFHLLIRVRSEQVLEKQFELLKRQGDKTLTAFQTLSGFEEDVPKVLSMQFNKLFNGYTQALNKQQKRKGSLFIRPFKRKQINDPLYFFNSLRYIHQNPVRHLLAKNLMDWPYNSIHAYLQRNESKIARDEVFRWFANEGSVAEKSFWKFHQQGWELEDFELEI